MRLPFLTVRHLPLRVICEYNTEFVLLLAGFPSREDVEMHVLRYCFVYCIVSFVSLRSRRRRRRRRRRRGFLKVPSVDGWATLRRKTATFPPFCAYLLFCLSPLT